jgi:hypothetical protein
MKQTEKHKLSVQQVGLNKYLLIHNLEIIILIHLRRYPRNLI